MNLAEQLRESLSKVPVRIWTKRPELLLLPNIPNPMHGMAPRVVLSQQWWSKTKEDACASTNYHCLACGVHKYEAKSHKWLEAHEVYDTDYLLGRMSYIETVPLCHFCHSFIHDGRMKALLDKGKFNHYKYLAVVRHGNQLLVANGLKKSLPYSGPSVEWGEWRLVVEGKEYPPKFKTQEEWEKAYE